MPMAHRVSAYVRCIAHLPHILFDGPACRLCSLHAGNEHEHVFACPALYVRACGALISCVDKLLSDIGWQVEATWDLVALLTRGSSVCWFAVEPNNTIAARQRALRQLGAAPHIVMSYSGLLWCSNTDVRHSHSDSAAVRAALATTVMRVMAEPIPLEPPVLQDHPSKSPYIEQGVMCARASQKTQSVLGFLVRRDPRLVVWPGPKYSVHLPLRSHRVARRGEYHVHVCGPSRCALLDPPGATPQVVICTCATELWQPWQYVHVGASLCVASDYRSISYRVKLPSL